MIMKQFVNDPEDRLLNGSIDPEKVASRLEELAKRLRDGELWVIGFGGGPDSSTVTLYDDKFSTETRIENQGEIARLRDELSHRG